VRTDLLEHSGFDFAMQKHIKTMNAVAELKEAVQSRNKPLKNVFLWQKGVVILEKDSKPILQF
jgi:hypothetical protein